MEVYLFSVLFVYIPTIFYLLGVLFIYIPIIYLVFFWLPGRIMRWAKEENKKRKA